MASMSGSRSVRWLAAALLAAGAAGTMEGTSRADQPGRTPPVTFTRNVAPIIFARCGQCHHPGGSAPFDLLSYSAVRQRATQIAAVTRSRLMPPWKAEPGYGEFVGQHPLTSTEIDLIQSWVDQGRLEGDPRDLPPAPQWTDTWQLGKPDLVVTLARPYTLPAGGTDVFRNFVIPVPVSVTRFVRAVEFRPGNPRVVHHANILIDPTPTSRQLDEQDPEPGYQGLVPLSAAYPDGHFLAWTPGQVAPLLPGALAWRLDPGTDLVVETHMQPSGRPETVQPSIGFYFGSDPPVRTPYMLRLSRQSIDIPAGQKEYAITDSYVLPVDVEIQAVQPHAHYRAREIKGLATLPDGTTRWLIYIKDWDFRWQHVYRYVSPFVLPRGTMVEMRYTYDNSADNPRNPQQPPQRAIWGQRTADEMGDLWIQVLALDDRDRTTLRRGFQPKMIAEDVIGYETLIRADPGEIRLHDDVAQMYLMLGRPTEAAAHFRTSVSLKPGSAAAHFNLGTALSAAGKLDDAIGEYRQALRINQDYSLAHNNLANALVAQGKLDEAVGEYREALRSNPSNVEAHSNLGNILLQLGNPDEALSHLREAVRIAPEFYMAHFNMGHVFLRRGDLSAAIQQLQDAVRLRPDWAPALIDLAWLLATAPDDMLRDGSRAVRLAERAVDLTGRREAGALDALAAAYAEAGLFDRALETAQTALQLDPAGPTADAIRARQALYRARSPYRAPRGQPGAVPQP
jgi:tetratricopeptide (TPR) repeat protein